MSLATLPLPDDPTELRDLAVDLQAELARKDIEIAANAAEIHAKTLHIEKLNDERIHPKTRPTWQVDLDHPRAFVHRRARIRTAILRRLPHQQSGRIEPPNCTFVLRLHNRADRKKPIRGTSGRCIGLCLLCRRRCL